ncbi:LysR substrate-binding domain-containing protein [Rhodopseudomonas sp. RCAM05734]|uniref:LysR substrate-binding domain-containing protein n=1 Tax=Rhodopseudomonas sp. RCAM05734 TaxID=3457549 RepID=UPI0040441760
MRGYVRVASSSSVLLGRLAADLSRFAELHPDIEIDLQEQGSEGTLEMVRNKEADIGLFVGAFEAQSLVTFPFVPRQHP